MLSLAGTHLKVWGDQFGKDHRHGQDHSCTSECQREPCSVPPCQHQWFNNLASGSCTSDQLLQQCSPCRPQVYLSVRSVREDRDQLVQERQRQGSKSKGQKGKGSKGSSSFQNSKEKQKGKGKTKSKGKGQWTTLVMESKSTECQLGSERSKRIKERQSKVDLLNLRKSGHASNQCWCNRDPEGWNSHGSAQQLKGSSGSQYSKDVYNIHQYPQDQPIQTLPPDQLRGSETYDLKLNSNNIRIWVKRQLNAGRLRQFSSSNQGGFSGQRLNINYLSEPCDLDSGIIGQEICASFPYSIGLGLPSHLQEPWAALIDSGAVTSTAPSSFAPHVPVTPHSGQLVNVNGGEIEIQGQKKVAYVTHMVVMHITFLIVEDVLNPIIGLDVLHQNSVLFHLFQTGKAYLQQKSQKAVLDYHKNQYYASGLVLSGYVKSSILMWDDPQYAIFDPQSTSQIIAEIDLEVNSQARITQPHEEEEDVSLESHSLNVWKLRNQSPQQKERLTRWLTCPFGHGARYVSVPRVSINIIERIKSSRVSFSWIIASTKFPGRHTISKCSLS